MSEGHLLLEDVPGTGKTALAKSIAASIGGDWHRIQFTPDMLPSDVTGAQILRDGELEFRKGPVFANIVLGDEINRASPKTQAALLEVMEERTVSVDGVTHDVPRPFTVLATQNPIEQEGTYRLPEAQLDRFLMRASLGYPEHEDEVEVLRSIDAGAKPEALEAVMTTQHIEQMVTIAQHVHLGDPIRDYVVRLAGATRDIDQLRLGVSTRGAVAMMRASKALAAAQGRVYVSPDDIKTLAPVVFSHRMLLTPDAELRRVQTVDLVEEVVDTVEAPGAVRS